MIDMCFERAPPSRPFLFPERRECDGVTFYELTIGCVIGVLYISVAKRI